MHPPDAFRVEAPQRIAHAKHVKQLHSMPTDILFPQKNEKALLEKAISHGYSTIFFVYDTLTKAITAPDIKEESINIKKAVLIKSQNKNKIIKEANQAHQKGIASFTETKNDLSTRFILEKTKVTGIINPENIHPKDHTHFRRSGLDQVSCKAAAKNKKFIITTLISLKQSKSPPKLLGRIRQNISLTKKYKVPYFITSSTQTPNEIKGANDIRALSYVLGMKSEQSKKADATIQKMVL
jgi:RNase P/RNase MRP subunit p30